jgi:hypothetical protein
MRMRSVSPEERAFQFKLIFVVVSVAFVLGFLRLWTWEAQYALFGATALACVVDVDDNVYNSNGARLPYPRIDYQYFDDGAKAVRSGSFYKYRAPAPALGETFTVEYLPNHDHSSFVAEGDHSLGLFWVTIPVMALILVLVGMCCLPARL